jgi:peptidoglycan glycosyltransferase
MTPMSGAGRPARAPVGRTTVRIGVALALAFATLAAGAGYWQVVRSDELVTRPDNPATIALRQQAVRGLILDREGKVLAASRRDADGLPYRVYVDDTVSQVVGYASRRYGTAGLERTYDPYLVGLRTGDARSDLLAKFRPTPYDPRDLRTSLSLDLQRRAIAELGSDRGAVVMLDPTTGEVLVLASTPTYDASGIADPATSEATFSDLQADPAQPLLPRATQGLYVPGSIFKIVTGAAGLRTGAISRSTTYPQQPPAEKDGLIVEGFRITDGHHPATGNKALDMIEATEVSCNIWYALAGLDTGGGGLSDGAAAFGFGAPLPFDLPTSVSQVTNGGGPLPGGFADDVELANAAYGQGETLATPLQMALVAATVANGGVLMEPRLGAALIAPDGAVTSLGPETVRRVLEPEDAATLVDAMTRAVEGDLGRRYTSGAKVPGILTAGKSGTAELGGNGEPHSWFIGFAPADDPKIAIAVLVEQGGRGGERAAPLAGRMMQAYFDRYGR